MYGVNEDRYWDQYQVTHDPQWYDADEDVEDDFNEWDQADIETKLHVSHGTIVKRLNELTCRHPFCTEGHPCRAAVRRYGGTMMCSALENTDFGKDVCPFFKTEYDFNMEYKRTNTLHPDPYELYMRGVDVKDEW